MNWMSGGLHHVWHVPWAAQPGKPHSTCELTVVSPPFPSAPQHLHPEPRARRGLPQYPGPPVWCACWACCGLPCMLCSAPACCVLLGTTDTMHGPPAQRHDQISVAPTPVLIPTLPACPQCLTAMRAGTPRRASRSGSCAPAPTTPCSCTTCSSGACGRAGSLGCGVRGMQ